MYLFPVLEYNGDGKYSFKPAAAFLLSATTGVNINLIKNVVVQERKAGRYRPSYDAEDERGAITVGTKGYMTITYTENYFSDDPRSYNNNGRGKDLYEWLDLSSHEVGHLPQVEKYDGLISYFGEFDKQYTSSFIENGFSSEMMDMKMSNMRKKQRKVQ